MIGKHHKSLYQIIAIMILLAGLSLSGHGIQSAKAAADYTQPQTPAEIISRINAYRKANGLPALQLNSLLSTLAQIQSEYQAQIGYVTHEGPGNTRPVDRALAAGYGGGANIFLSEIIYGGMTADVPTAMNWWKNSEIHNSVMLSSTYAEIGAGVANNGNATYFTALLGVVAGGTAPTSPAGSSGTNSGNNNSGSQGNNNTQPAAPVVIAVPVMKATPRSDGAIIHVIQTGQALWTLAAVYEIDLQTLLTLNGLTEYSYIFPGDEIIIQPASGDGGSSNNTENPGGGALFSGSPNPTKLAAATEKAKATESALATQQSGPPATKQPAQPTPKSTAPKGETPTPATTITAEDEVPPSSPAIRWIVILAFVIIFMVVVGSMFFQKTPQPPPNDDVVR